VLKNCENIVLSNCVDDEHQKHTKKKEKQKVYFINFTKDHVRSYTKSFSLTTFNLTLTAFEEKFFDCSLIFTWSF
jgi:hypothetical protein